MRHQPLFIAILFLLFCLILPVLSAATEDGIGKVIALRGKVNAETDAGAVRPLAIDSTVLLGDTLRTGKSGRLQVLFQDSTIVSLGPASEMVVADYAWNGQSGRMKTVVNEGVFRVLGGSITKTSPKEFTTETPAATIGIRGSMYAGRVSEGRLQVVFQGGTGIYVRTPVNTVEIGTVGMGTRVEAKGAAAAAPYQVPPEELEAIDPLKVPTEPEETADAPPADSEATAAAPAEEEPAEEASTDQPPAEDSSTEGSPAEESPVESLTETPVEEAPSKAPAEAPAVLSADGLPAPVAGPVPAETASMIGGGGEPLAPPVIEGLTELGQQAVLDVSTDTLATDAVPPPPPTVRTSVSGRYMAVQDDLDPFNGIADKVWIGTVGGETSDGRLTGQANTNNGAVPLDPMTVAAYDPSLAYRGFSKLPDQDRNLNLLGSPVEFTTATIGSDNAGQFAVFTLDDYFNSPSYSIRELGFAGVPSESLLPAGIVSFRGPVVGTLKDVAATEFEGFSQNFILMANLHNRKVFGIIETPVLTPGEIPDAPGFFFGDISGTGIVNVRVIGQDIVALDDFGPDGGVTDGTITDSTVPDGSLTGPTTDFMPLTIDGGIEFGQFYGRQMQGVGFVASGNTYDVMSQELRESWRLTGAGFREPGTLMPAPTGTVTWQGFALGIADNMTSPDINRRFFMNTQAADFSLTVNRDAGTVSGIFNAIDLAGSSTAINGLVIGGANGSAYVDDHLIAAVLGGTSPLAGATLRPHGNYLLSEDPARRVASYATWGTWELAFEEPGTMPVPYHVHVPGSMWVAGQRTPATEVQSLIATGFTATYVGRAEGVGIPSFGSYYELNNGQTALNVDFGTQTFNGNLNFTEVNLPVAGTLTSAGLNGAVTSAPGQSLLQGAFYGPAADSVAGSFDAQISGGDRYQGIFGGDR